MLHRRLLAGLIGPLALLCATAAVAAPARVATLDWTLAETLVALGHPPVATAQVDAYRAWVRKPALPDSIIDLGLRTQPNLELLASIDPDRILISPMFANLAPRLERIAPVDSLALFSAGHDTWSEMRTLTRSVASLIDRPQAATRLIDDTETHLETLKQRLGADTRPLLIVQLMDARHVRVFGDNGLYQAVLERLGLTNAWSGNTNAWGFSLAPLEALIGIDAQLVVIKPYPAGVRAALTDSSLWQALVDRHGAPLVLEPVWSFGALPSARRFADLLVTAMENTDGR